ncbi:MAG: hypothetical protein ABL986_20960 [Vicinamibacterales bacterium]
MPKRPRPSSPFAHHPHSLSVVVAGVVVMFLALYSRADPDSHLGAFFGNAIADWLGVLVFIVATKYFYEVGSAESRTPPRQFHRRAARFLMSHSLTLILALTGLVWTFVYNRSDVDSRAGEVVGNIVSEWTQLLGLVVITKYAREAGSKEGG